MTKPVTRGRTPKQHDHDAGGPRELLAAKRALREEVWAALRAGGAARFPGARGRIPNFVGAEAAAERLRATADWARARTLKCNPDSPQLPVRRAALADGKRVAMAVPRLAEALPFYLLDPKKIAGPLREAASIRGASRAGVAVDVPAIGVVDMVVTGCVAVDESGARLGKGGGFSDLELAIAAEAGLVGTGTVVVTTVHELQVRPRGEIPVTDHDIRLDLIVTPERVIRCARTRRPALRVRWDELTDDKIAAIPLLKRLRAEARR